MQHDVLLAPYTSLRVGGPAEQLYICNSGEDVHTALIEATRQSVWILGYGANALISDAGLPGTTLLVRTGHITREGDTLIADAGVWWDDLVQLAIREQLWGLELMSAIPGGVGAAVVGNIAAYGQAVANTLVWIEVFDRTDSAIRRLPASDLNLDYRYSAFQSTDFADLIILRAAFGLHRTPITQLEYQAALDVVQEKHYDISTLSGCREAILETRRRAGSLWDYRHPEDYLHTAGSFFRNPLVGDEALEKLMAYEENGRTAEMVRRQNQLHGGAQKRVSAAHVLLAAGFQRGQAWGPVRLHPDHILKIENTGNATAQQIYDVAQEIIRTVRGKLGIELIPEVRPLGKFS
ncbi:MAG TPA: FAD-binding protein [Verrucomicrobiae bacterium]|nr:FAD-binding protein [Verrucomicrobiae bacterium]